MRPKLQLDELNKALLITCGVCYLMSFVLNRYAGASTLFRILFAAAAVFLKVASCRRGEQEQTTIPVRLCSLTASIIICWPAWEHIY